MRSVTRARPRSRPVVIVLVVAVTLTALFVPAAAAAPPPPVYVAQPLPNPLPVAEVLMAGTSANDINSRGEVAGTSSVHSLKSVALKWSANGQPTILSARPYTTASAINERGDVIGSSWEGNVSKAAIWLRNGSEVIVEPQAPATGTMAVDINDRGQVLIASVKPFAAFPAIYEILRVDIYHRGVLTEVTGLPPVETFPNGGIMLIGLDNSGRVYGNWVSNTIPGDRTMAFVWSEGHTEFLGSLGGGSSRAMAVSRRGHVTGSSTKADGTSPAFVWHEGVMTDLGTLGGHSGQGMVVNELGQVAGTSITTDGFGQAFFWSPGKSMVKIPPLDGRSYVEPADINNRGQVTGTGWNNGNHAFVWHRGTMVSFTAAPGDSRGHAINKHGVMVGQVRPNFIYQTGFPMTWSPAP